MRLSSALMQPILSDDVSAALADIAIAEPLNGMIELAGPEPIRMNDLVASYLTAHGDGRQVITDDSAGYFGTPVDDRSLTPGESARLGETRFVDWLDRETAKAR